MNERRGDDWCPDCQWEKVDMTTFSDPARVEIFAVVMTPCPKHRLGPPPSALRAGLRR